MLDTQPDNYWDGKQNRDGFATWDWDSQVTMAQMVKSDGQRRATLGLSGSNCWPSPASSQATDTVGR